MVIQNKIKQKGGAPLTVLTTKYPSNPSTCKNPIGWLHAIESFHLPHSSIDESRVGPTGFIFYSGNVRMGLKGCPETSARNYHNLLRNNPEERTTQLIPAGSLK